MAYLQHTFTADSVKGIIIKDFPDFPVDSITLIDNGWDNAAFDVNGAYIFRFPKDEHVQFETELKVLQFLRKKITLLIPNPEFIGKELRYMGYKKIQGDVLGRKIFESLSALEHTRLITDIVRFFCEIHSAINVPLARVMGIRNDRPNISCEVMEKIIRDHINDPIVLNFMERTASEYKAMLGAEVPIVFLYNDLHTDNMAFNSETKKLNGVFDFGDISIGDVNKEFYQLYRFDPELMKEVAEKYEIETSRKISQRRVVLYSRMNELNDLAECINRPDSSIYKNAFIFIRKWYTNMDQFKEK